MKKLFAKQFVRYIFVGGINTIFGYGIFALFLYLGLHYTLAAFFSTVLGILFNFKTIGTIVFKSHQNCLIFKFFGVYGITYVLNVFCLFLFSLININAYLAGAILVLPLSFISFTLNKKYVFYKINNDEIKND